MQEFHDFLAKNFPLKTAEAYKIDKLFGQASARQYFRVHNGNDTAVLMKLPNGFSSPAEEVTKVAEGAPSEFPFLNVARYLKNLKVNVPQILGEDDQAGLILLEDLGDESFENLIQKSNPELVTFYYQKAIEVLIQMQMATAQHPDQNCIAYHRHFDADLLNWEFDHFVEYGIEDRLQICMEPEHKELFTKTTRALTQDILQMPQGFVHRDFQSRNIMFHNMDFYIIDFQDALQGPVLYDLVALLRDSYIDLSQTQVESLLQFYSDKLPEGHPYFSRKESLAEDFYKIVLQRKLKDAGRFQYIHTVRKNPNFLVHLPLTLTFLRNSFPKVGEASALQECLAQYVEEFR